MVYRSFPFRGRLPSLRIRPRRPFDSFARASARGPGAGRERGRNRSPRVLRSRWPGGLPRTFPVRTVLTGTSPVEAIPVGEPRLPTIPARRKQEDGRPPSDREHQRVRPGPPDRLQWMHPVRPAPNEAMPRGPGPARFRGAAARIRAVVRRARAQVGTRGGAPLRGRCPGARARSGGAAGCRWPGERLLRGPGSRVGRSVPIAPSTALRRRATPGQPLPPCGASRPCGGAPARCSSAASGIPPGRRSPGTAPRATGHGAGGAASRASRG